MNRLLARHLKELRLARHYTQSYVSSQIHLSRSSYSNYENGMRTPTLEILVALADFYDISIDALIGSKASAVSILQLASDERYLISVYRKLTDEKKKKMISDAINYFTD